GEGDGGVAHAVREAPFVVVPGQDAHEGAFHDLGLVHVEDRRTGIVVQVGRDQLLVSIPEDVLELAFGRGNDGLVDLGDRGGAAGHELEIHHRNVWGRYPD